MSITLDGLESPQTLTLHAGGPGPCNKLIINAGVALCNFEADDDSWHRDTLDFAITPSLEPKICSIVASASLNSITYFNLDKAGWAMDTIESYQAPDGEIHLRLHLAVRGNHCALRRIGYQVTILME